MHTVEQLRKGEYLGLKHIKIAEGLKEFPLEVLDLSETLEILDLSGNELDSLPDAFANLKCLKIAFFSENQFQVFPEILAMCPQLEMIAFKSNQIRVISPQAFPPKLRWLILTNNQIEILPDTIGNCYRLQKLALAGNRLKELPVTLKRCEHLELLRISANELYAFPDFLLELPRLAWLAFAGNPFSFQHQKNTQFREFDFRGIQLNTLLGQGASGMIYKAKLAGFEEEVAVKIFKGEITSDGYPEDEMNACLLASGFPNLVQVLGPIQHHPEDKMGLVMKLIPSHFKNLGLAPNFESCSRDVFPTGTKFSVHQIISIAKGVAELMKHFHALGICHGDLYAHNILYAENGDHLLGDFGAATLYDKNHELASKIEKMEMRSYGYLLEDLINHADDIHSIPKELIEIKEHCLTINRDDRPLFSEVCMQFRQHFTLYTN